MINYILVTKPGIIMGNLITFAAGFVLATQTHFQFQLFAATLFGLGCLIASGCVFNNIIDRYSDQKMKRTKSRALVKGDLKAVSAFVYGALLFVLGNLTYFLMVNLLTAALANLGFFVYVFLYSFLKKKTHFATLIGSISGAIPPIVGYTAVSGRIDTTCVLLFCFMIVWQMPHFYAIALKNYDDYKEAQIPVLPLARGIELTKLRMMGYIALYFIVIALFTIAGSTSLLFFTIATVAGLVWFAYGINGFRTKELAIWARGMFILSLVVINTVCLMVFIDIFVS